MCALQPVRHGIASITAGSQRNKTAEPRRPRHRLEFGAPLLSNRSFPHTLEYHMTLRPWHKWGAALLLASVALPVILIAIFGWNWLRGPIERKTLEKTGRELLIRGDFSVHFGWPLTRIHSGAVTFANPAWAAEKQMLAADSAEIAISLPQLLMRNIVLDEVRLGRPVVFLEQGADGRRNWLLDIEQQDESARIRIDRLVLDQGKLGYDDVAGKTRIRSELSTANVLQSDPGVVFSAQGQYKGLPLRASGNGGPVLAMRDESTPYPLKIDANIGRTVLQAEGTITSLLRFSAMDMRVALSGDSLEQLFPLFGIAFPATPAYKTSGHMVRVDKTWRYEKFSGRFGASDIAGTLQIDTGGKRPAMKGELDSKLLDVADLGPLIGAQPGKLQAARASAPASTPSPAQAATTPARARVLPDLPFNAGRWDSVDAEVTLKAAAIRRAGGLPLENLLVHLSLRDSVLKLDPLDFGFAGGHLASSVTLHGSKNPIHAQARLQAKKILIAKLLPDAGLTKSGIGEINGQLDLKGSGNSVGQMLADASGSAGLVVAGGEISKLMMEKAGLHLWEMLVLNLTGDRLVKLRCGVADFDIRKGIMRTDALILDTEITTLIGTGDIDLGQEKLDLTLNQRTKNTSPLALRSPIHIRGTFAKPEVEVDKRRMATRALGALALGLANPLLALIPLIDAGPGKDSDCGQLTREARAVPRS